MSTLETLQDILVREHKLAPEQLLPDAPLSSLGIDSLAMIELMFQVEDRFHITLPDDHSTDFATLNDVVRFVDNRLSPEPAVKDAAAHSAA
jgi:acyl carrier protein